MLCCMQPIRSELLTDVRVWVFESSDDDLLCPLKTIVLVLQVVHKHERGTLVPPSSSCASPTLLFQEHCEHLQLPLMLPQHA